VSFLSDPKHWRVGDLLPPSPPAEQTNTRKDQSRKSRTGDGARNPAHAAIATRDSVVETPGAGAPLYGLMRDSNRLSRQTLPVK
jgi:hypothetical protein